MNRRLSASPLPQNKKQEAKRLTRRDALPPRASPPPTRRDAGTHTDAYCIVIPPPSSHAHPDSPSFTFRPRKHTRRFSVVARGKSSSSSWSGSDFTVPEKFVSLDDDEAAETAGNEKVRDTNQRRLESGESAYIDVAARRHVVARCSRCDCPVLIYITILSPLFAPAK